MVDSASGARALDRESPMPLWAQLADELRRRVDAEEFVDRFPTEAEVSARYDVSRHTVREALRRLREAGLLSSRRGQGTVVNKRRFEQRLGAIYSLFRVVEAQGAEQRSVVRALDRRTDERAAAALGVAPHTEFVYIERLRLADAEPLALDRSWLPADVAAPLLGADFTRTGMYDELASRCGLRPDGGGERIYATVPTADERQLLGVRAGVATFSIERIARVRDRSVEWRTTLVRGDRYGLTINWGESGRLALAVAPVDGG